MVIFPCLLLLIASICFIVGAILVNDDRTCSLKQNKDILSKNTIGSNFNLVIVKENKIRVIIDIFLIMILSIASIGALVVICFVLWGLK